MSRSRISKEGMSLLRRLLLRGWGEQATKGEWQLFALGPDRAPGLAALEAHHRSGR